MMLRVVQRFSHVCPPPCPPCAGFIRLLSTHKDHGPSHKCISPDRHRGSKELQVAGFYRRPLPSSLIAFSSNAGKQIFKEALAQGYMEGYFRLAEQFTTQSEPALCGPGTLAMVLNALALDPKRVWKGPWRWFTEEVLTCTTEHITQAGLTMTEFQSLAECNGAHSQMFSAEEVSLHHFRHVVKAACRRSDMHLVCAYSRQALGQTGEGHFSPIGGYHESKDLALILDVARFKYPPYWCPVPLLYDAMKPADITTNKGRGYFLLSKSRSDVADMCRISVESSAWNQLASHFCETLPAKLKQQKPSTVSDVIRIVFDSLPSEMFSVLTFYTHELSSRVTFEEAADSGLEIHNVFADIRKTDAFRIVDAAISQATAERKIQDAEKYGVIELLSQSKSRVIELSTILFLAVPSQLYWDLPLPLKGELLQLRHKDLPTAVQDEVRRLRDQMGILSDACVCQSEHAMFSTNQDRENSNGPTSRTAEESRMLEDAQADHEAAEQARELGSEQATGSVNVKSKKHRFMTLHR